MMFNNFSFPNLPFSCPSLASINLPRSPLNLMSSLRSNQKNEKNTVKRVFAGHSFALSNGIKPAPSNLPNRFIHTRLNKEGERLLQMRKTLEETQFDLKLLRSLRERKKQNARVIEKASSLERQMEREDSIKRIADLEAEVEHWREVSNMHEQKLSEAGEHVLVLKDMSMTSSRLVQTLRAQRDESRALFARQKELTEDAENRRITAVSSIQKRCDHQKALVQDESQKLRGALHGKDETITELEKTCKTYRDEAQDRQMALCDCVEEIDLLSDKASCILSEMHGVLLLRPDKEEGVWDKMRDMHDGIKDLVREVKTRRKHSVKMAERIFTLEEERLMWSREAE